jgi:hypothetical protein
MGWWRGCMAGKRHGGARLRRVAREGLSDVEKVVGPAWEANQGQTPMHQASGSVSPSHCLTTHWS